MDFTGKRASIGNDGTVRRNETVLGFINGDGSAGDAYESIWIAQ